MALGDAILACLTERPMTGYELAKTFDNSIGFFWKADHQQIYRELTKLRDRGHIQGREVVQSGKPNKLVYTLTPEGRRRAQALGRAAERSGLDQGRPAGAALCARQRRRRTVAHRPDGAAGTSPRPFRPLRAPAQQTFSPRHGAAGRCRQTARTSHRPRPRARRGGVVRRGDRGVVGPHLPARSGPTSCPSKTASAKTNG